MFVYGMRKHIARMVFFPILLILLLGLTFKIWGGVYSQNDPQFFIVNQSHEIENCYVVSHIHKNQEAHSIVLMHLFEYGFINDFINFVLLPFTGFLFMIRSTLFFERRNTLVSLCVRMDD